MRGSKWKTFIICAGLAAAVSGFGGDTKKVSISVQSTAMRDVLKFIAEQGDTSIVISPEVSDQLMDITIKDIPLEEALDVVLKPYGCGYTKIGKTVVVDRLDNLSRLAEVEPLVSRVFKLNYLDAKGVNRIVEGLMSDRGKAVVLTNVQQLGWQFAASSADAKMAKAERVKASKDSDEAASKTLVVTDTPSVLTRIQEVIDSIDVKPRQVEIRSHFVEFNTDFLRDIGVQWGVSKTSGEYQTGRLLPSGAVQNTLLNSVLTGVPAGSAIDGGLNVGLVREGDIGVDFLLNMAENNEGVNVLSAPRIVAQENQEAAIIVGRKVPIITTESEGQSGSISTKVEYYERIGIQLNVIPQICDDNRISMVIHPAVTEQDGVASAKIGSLGGSIESQIPLTEYPIIRTREAETRLITRSGETVSIGGLVLERNTEGVDKVPFLGDVPYLGRLFRRDVNHTEQIELVILLKATLMDELEVTTDAIDRRIDQANDEIISYWENQVAETYETLAKEQGAAPATIGESDPDIEELLQELETSKNQIK
jgi:type IV pilus assembly protein PilQ